MRAISLFRRPELLWRALPQGRRLPEEVWWQRHRGILVLLWLHAPAVTLLAAAKYDGIEHVLLEGGLIAGLAALATGTRRTPATSTVIASIGLMTASAALVHLSDGLIEMHFHYFVMVAVVTLYQDWRPFLVAIGYVVLQHGVAGAVGPESVYNHVAAVESPWKWAGVHGGFIFAMSVAGIVSWRLNESLLSKVMEREQQLAEAQELARLGSWEYRAGIRSAWWSKEMYQLLGVGSDFETVGDSVASLIHPDDRDRWQADMIRATTVGAPLDLDFRVVRPDGCERWLHSHGEVTAWEDGAVSVMAGTTQDITDRRRAEDELRARETQLEEALSLLQATLDSTADGILVVDNAGRITSFNGKFVTMWRIPQPVLDSRDDAAAIRHVLDQLVDPEHFVAKVEDLYAQPAAESYDTITFKDGRVFERFSTPQRVAGEIVGRVWSFRDVTDRMRLEDELAHQAFHDSLTSLANQALFRDRLEHALARRHGANATELAVMFLDLDNFKHVNDSLGHNAGNELLVAVTARLLGCLRPADTAARLGGDEFAVLLEDLTAVDEASAIADRMLEALRLPFEIAGIEVFISASIGIATDSVDSQGDQLLRNADLAMYTAKRLGKNRAEMFVPEMHAAAVDRLEVEAELRRACERDELRLHYQPIVSLRTKAVHSVEALVRWQHPVRGLLSPAAFIPYAEESGLIDAIGGWVLETACEQTCRWQHELGTAIGVSVNLSTRQLRNESITRAVASVLERTGLPPASLTLEITESAMMEDTQLALEHLSALKELGVQLAVDDFGTGYSSLSYLQQFPIDVLKIDRSFVERVDRGPEESSLARAIVRLAQTLHLSAVAEGVETEAQLAWLRDVGCTYAQGYHLGRPMPADAVPAWLAAPSDGGGVEVPLRS